MLIQTLAAAVPLAVLLLPQSPSQGGVPSGSAAAQETEGELPLEFDVAQMTAMFAEGLDFEAGRVQLASGEAGFDLPEGWAYLQAADARRVVEQLWGNPPSPATIGFIDPPHPDGRLQSDYGVIVSLELDGYIEDDDAAETDFAGMMKELQSASAEINAQRAERGYPTVELCGWAEPPHYDGAAKKLHWAKELRFEGEDESTLNYDVRVLGRRGALVLQAVAPLSAFDDVKAGMRTALDAASFNEGHRYADFDSSLDKVAAYGIGGLVAGKVAMKVGFFAALAKFGKVIVVGVIGAVYAFKRFVFGGREQPNPHTYEDPVEPVE